MDPEMELAKAIEDGSLELICPEMQLLVCPGYHEVALQGAGVIRADDLGQLYFRMISPFQGTPHRSLQPSKRPGELYRPEDHVMLKAVDDLGREWRSSWMIVDTSDQIPLPNYRLQKNLSNILHFRNRNRSDRSFVRMLIPGSAALPLEMATHKRETLGEREIGWSASVDSHVHRIGEAEVTFRRMERRWLSVFATRLGAFMPTWPGLMCHSLGFVTAQTIRPAVILRAFDESENLELLSGPFWRFASAMPGPVDVNAPTGADDFWRLLELFFNHIEQTQFEDNPLVEELAGTRRGAQGSFQTACLTLAVAIESIAKLLLKNESPPRVCAEEIRALTNHLEKWSGDDKLKERAKGAIGRLMEISAADVLYAWATRTGVPHELVNSWKKLRHPKAHGGALDEEQLGHDLYYSAVELMYRIVGSAIGYGGRIIPTSRRGWVPDSDDTSAADGEVAAATKPGKQGPTN